MNTGYFLASVLFRILECIADNALASLCLVTILIAQNRIRIYTVLYTNTKDFLYFRGKSRYPHSQMEFFYAALDLTGRILAYRSYCPRSYIQGAGTFPTGVVIGDFKSNFGAPEGSMFPQIKAPLVFPLILTQH